MGEITRRAIENREAWLDWRRGDITASVGAALFGADIHPHSSAYQLWAYHSGLWKPEPINPKLARRGHYVEKIAPDLVREERPNWNVGPNESYYCDPDERIGATPDLEAWRPDVEGKGTVQVKSVGVTAFRRWRNRDTGETELPLWIGIQANIEAGFMDATWAAVAAITIGDHGLDIEIIDVPVRPEVMAAFRRHAAEFWRRVEAKEPFEIDWGKDVATVLGIYADDDGSVVDLTGDSAFETAVMLRENCKIIEREGTEAEKRRKLLDAQIIHRLGNAAAARCSKGLIKAPTVSVKEALRRAYKYRRISVSLYSDARQDSPPDTDSPAREAS
jgi:hypothetical protein